jgi:hypothetical protein
MTGQVRRREILSNPFFVILLATSALFVLTVLGYLVSPFVLVPGPAAQRPGPGSIKMAEWFDRNGPLTLGVEFAVMLVAGILAMATDSWFTSRAKSKERAGEA